MMSGFGCGVDTVGVGDDDVWSSFDDASEDSFYEAGLDLPDVEDASFLDSHESYTFDAAEEYVETPPPPRADYFMSLPCAFPSSIDYKAGDNSFLVACGGGPNALYKSPDLSEAGSGDWTIIGYVDGYPSHHIELSDQYYMVNHFAPDGFTIINENTGAPSQTVNLSEISPVDEEGRPLSFVPNNPSGAVYLGADLCVATSNMDDVDADPFLSTFHSGTVICFPYHFDGTVDEGAGVAYYTSGKNATGVTLIDSEPRPDGTRRFAVLSSNSYAPLSGEEAALDIFEWPDMSKTTIGLGSVTAQISPTLDMTPEGVVLVGLQRPQAAVVGLDIVTHGMIVYREFPEVKNFIVSSKSRYSVAVVSDFGIFGEGGRILFGDMDPYGWSDTLALPLGGALGPSVIVDDILYQTVTGDTEGGAGIWSVDVISME